MNITSEKFQLFSRQIPSAVLQVVRCLNNAGYQALLAGGCVRDMLIGNPPEDYDVATDATPQQVAGLFRRTLLVGAQFGVVVVLIGDSQIEVATFRSDDAYIDGRRPSGVHFTDARTDAQRRDFTINGIFYHPVAGEVIDYVQGQRDLDGKVIRAIGNPAERFAEDYLRMLRALRFAARLNFTIEPQTFQAICQQAENIQKISAERITAELMKMVTDRNRNLALRMADDSGLLAHIFTQVPRDDLTQGLAAVYQLRVDALKQATDDQVFALVLALLIYRRDKQDARKICRYLKTSNNVRDAVWWLTVHRDEFPAAALSSKGRLKQWLAAPGFVLINELVRAIYRAESRPHDKFVELDEKIHLLGNEPLQPPAFLDGNDLITLGVKPGPLLGKMLKELYLQQLEGNIKNTDQARGWVIAELKNT